MLSIRRIYTTIVAMLTLCATTMAETTFSGPVRYVTTSGNYANDGTSWEQAKNNLQDAIESLHDYMTRNGITEGRVYVAAGTYRPTTSTPGGDGVLYTSFLIYEGITVYGGFNAANPEATPEKRLLEDGTQIGNAKGLKWKLKNPTILSGNHSSSSADPMTWNSAKNEYDESFTGNSYHVVWFATNTSTYSSGLDTRNRAVGLANKAAIDGFTIQEGNASNRTVPEETDGRHAYHNSYGGGVYMVANSEVRNCIIRQNASALRGGGVYMDGGGLLEQCHVTQNQSDGVGVTDGYGGGVACDDGGIVRNCIIENNAGRCGGGLSIAFSSIPSTDKERYASYASGCVVANNTSQAEAGGVFMRNGGLLNHLTITYNNCVGAGVVYNNRRYGRSGGLYVDGGGMVANSVIWGNEVAANNNVQYATYRESSTTPKVKFDFVALSKYNYVDWSGTVKRSNGVYSLNEENRNTTTAGYYPDFTTLPSDKGVIDAAATNARWIPRSSSYLRHQGMQLNDYPTSANYPNGSDYETEGKDIVDAFLVRDMTGKQFAPRCVLGAFVANSPKGASADVVSVEDNTTPIRTVFIDPSTDAVVSPVSEDDNTPIGNSWDNPFNNINDALDYVKTLTISDADPVQMLVKQGTTTTAGNSYLPYIRSSFIDLPSHVRLYGGFASSLTDTDISKRNPKAYPTRITANITGSDYAENGCHIITVRHGATDVIVDGLQLYFANAQTSSVLPTLALEGGAGIAVINSYDNLPMKNIKIRNCVVANCTASQGSALFLRNTPGATMNVDVENCIFHNNAVTRQQAATVEATGSNATLNLNHCLIRGNVGYGVMATDNANINVKNTALHANINYDSNSGSSNLKITDLHATEADPDSKVVTFLTSTDGTIAVADGASSSNNMMDLGVSDAVATAVATAKFSYHSSYISTYPKFVNPTSNIGVNKEGDVTLYGGDPNWMPTNTNPMVNAANETGTSATDPSFGKDMTTVFFRNYGGAADIGAVENHNDVAEGDTSNEDVEGRYQPPYGKVIYVRDYRNPDGTIDTTRDGDGSSWQKAINGNLAIDKYKNNHGFGGVDAELYEEGYQLTGLQWAVDEAFARSLERNADNSIKYTEITGVTHFNPGSQSTVNPDRKTIKVSTVDKSKRVQVWIGEGEYIRREGFFMRDAVDVYGGFPGKGGSPLTPGMKERVPKTSILETLTNEEATAAGDKGVGNYWGPQVDDYAHSNGFIQQFSGLNMSNWEIADVSTQGVSGYYSFGTKTWNGKAEYAFDDGNDAMNTFWHSKYNTGDGEQTSLPHYVTVDMGVVNQFTTLRFTSRNYHPKDIKFYYSTDNENWTEISKTDIGNVNDNNSKDIDLSDVDISARYFKFSIESLYKGDYADVKDIKLGTKDSNNSFSALSRATWNVIGYSSQEWGNNKEKYIPNYPTGFARHILDNNNNSYWETQRANGQAAESNPQFITVNLGSSYDFNSIQFEIRTNADRSFKDVTIFGSKYSPKTDYINWTKDRKRYSCRLSEDIDGKQTVALPETWNGQYVTLMVTDLYTEIKYPDIKELKVGNITDGNFTALSCTMSVEDYSTEERYGESNGTLGQAGQAIDGNVETYWHTSYNNVGNSSPLQYVVIDMKSQQTFSQIYFNSAIKIEKVTIETSSDGTSFTTIGSFNLEKFNETILNLPSSVNTRYVKISFDKMYDTTSKAVKLYGIKFGSGGSYMTFYDLNSYANTYKTQRVLTQPYPYFKGKGNINGSTQGNNLEFDNDPINPFCVITSWDGFVIRNGRTKITHQRDGGAGVALRINGRLANCVIKNNVLSSGSNTRGAGVFQNGGIIENCEIDGNILNGKGGNVYGGGLYQRTGTVFNTSVINNKITGNGDKQGTGVFFENGRFYNNTITANEGPKTLYSGKWFSNGRIDVYNSIIYNNNTTNGSKEFDCTTGAGNITLKNCLFKDSNAHKPFNSSYTNVDVSSFVYMDAKGMSAIDLFKDPANGDYSLKEGAIAINMGTDQLGKNMEGTADIVLPSYDAQYADRIQDCTVDIGAYEFNGAYSITPDETTSTDKAVFYVTQNGRGTGSAANPENAACWTKLQKVLDAAGRYLYSHKGDVVKKQVIVKLAGDAPTESVESGNKTYKYSGFVYRPRRSNKVTASGQEVNTRDYTIIVPHGVEVWGGYSDAFTSSDNNGFYTKTTTTTQDESGNDVTTTTYTDNRDILKNRTTLSGVYQADDQDVNVYNVVTFTNDTYNEEGALKTANALQGVPARAVLDGLFIEDGNADGEKQSTGQRTDTRVGGAAIVTKYAHIRNCIVQNNKATDAGGGLYLEEGALVSGSIVQYNEVTKGDGGGLYVEEPTSSSPENSNSTSQFARIYTSDIIYNTASGAGGGISFTTDGTPNVRANSVLFWQNMGSEQSNVNGMTTPSDAGNTTLTIEDYPISFCATETTREPGINNISVNTDVEKGVRFDTETYNHDYTDAESKKVTRMHNSYEFYKIKKYSLLARGGMEYKDYNALVKSDALTADDMAKMTRTFDGNDFIDIGARAIGELVLPVATANNLMTRIFVVKNEEDVATASVEVMQNQTQSDYYKQEGSSFAYPMRYLDDALEYVRDARKLKDTNGNYTNKDKKFQIILSGGTYYPMRNIKGEYVNSRGRTYLVPEGVTIVGGVEVKQTSAGSGDTYYGNTKESSDNTTFNYNNSSVVISHPEIKDIIKGRKLSDINHNNIAEPWEMAVQTILSGQVVNSNTSENVYHVIACIADEKHVGGLPTATITYNDKTIAGDRYDANAGHGTVPYYRGVPVIIDGVEIEDGMAMGYDKDAVNSVYTYYKGGAICVEGNWITKDSEANSNDENIKTYPGIERPVGYRNIPLELRNCNFRNNGGCLGGAIFTDSELKVFACNFVQNYAKVETDIVDGNNVTYAGRGGAINASYNTVIVNSLFANNEADPEAKQPNNDIYGVGGAILLGEYSSLHMINCDIVKNKAYGYPAIYCYQANKGGSNVADNPHKIVNSIFWGNEISAGDQDMNMVVNFTQDANDKTKKAEMLWFCAYEEGKGNEPVNSKNKIDYRLQKYTGFGTYIPQLWTEKYFYLDSDNTTIKESTIDNPDANATTGLNPVTCNIIIDSENDAINGPNFINPSSKAGRAGYYTSADWMIGRINNLVDNGWTFLQQDLSGEDPTFVYEEEKAKGAGIYRRTAYDYDNVNTNETAVPIGNDPYMAYADGSDKAMLRISTDPNPTHHQTYIDLGVYEYQHVKLDPMVEDEHIDVLWVTQQERTSASVADGKTWATATSDVQRAIETLLASRNGHDKEIRMLEGQYQPVYTINGNLGFTITTDVTTGIVPPDWSGSTAKGVNSLTIRGGYSKDVEGLENIHDYPVYLFASERSGMDGKLLGHVFVIGDVRQRESSGNTSKEVTTDVKNFVVPVYLDGLTFCNVKSAPHQDVESNDCHGGAAVFYKDQKKDDKTTLVGTTYVTEAGENISSGENTYTQYPIKGDGTDTDYPLYKLTINRCDFRINGSTNAVPAVTIGEGGGEALIYNSVFHSNKGKPLVATDTKVVNCTFALNGGGLEFADKQGKSEMHNSVLWRNNGYANTAEWTGLANTESNVIMSYNAISSLKSDDDVNMNVTLSDDNNNVLQGPNFFDPALSAADNWAKASRDFRVNPSAKIIGKASPKKYVELVKDLTGRYPYTTRLSGKSGTTDADYEDMVKQDFDLANNMRYYGSAGMERGAYECIATLSRVLYVNPSRESSSTDYNGFSWEKAYTKGNLQTAIDAAAVYSNVNNSDKSYVFVKGMTASTGETISMRDNVTLYGSLPSTTKIDQGVAKTTDSETGAVSYTDKDINDYINAMDSDRDAMASTYAKHTIVNGVKSTEALTYCLFDGLLIGNEDNGDANSSASPVVDIQQGNVALRNSIIANNEMTADAKPLVNLQSGLLYNTLIRDNTASLVSLGSNGYMLNCTVVGGDLSQVTTPSNAINNIIYKVTDAAMPFAPYFCSSKTAYHNEIPAADLSNHNLWYQLHERAKYIENGENGTTTNSEGKYDGKSHVATELRKYVDYTSDRDLLGNPRLIGNKVDNGCFETWSTGTNNSPSDIHVNTLATNYGGHNYPHEGSVVYLQKGGNLICDVTSAKSPYFTDTNPLRPGYLLAMEGGSLYGQGNSIALRYVAAERTIAGQYALLSMPFDMDYRRADGSSATMPFVTTTTYDSNNNITETAVASFDRYEYDGEARSHYQYSFAENDSKCWKQLTSDSRVANEGMLIDRGQDASSQTMRFTAYGATPTTYPYSESADKDYVTLQQYDDREATNGGSDFTSVYNMGWNLKGMPYLISNYPAYKVMDDGTYAMNVPHVVYTMKADGSYDVAKQSWTTSTENTLSPGVAFFTQTAIIIEQDEDKKTENLHFAQLLYEDISSSSANTRSAVTISLAASPVATHGLSADEGNLNSSPKLGEVARSAGEVCLLPIESTSDETTSLVYTINRDGAKFMSMNPAVPDIAVCGAGSEMMSLAGAAPMETEISVATRVGTTGRYTFSLNRNTTTEVWLKDYQTGIVTNLMEEDYTAEITADATGSVGVSPAESAYSSSSVAGKTHASSGLNTGRFSVTIGVMRPELGGRDNDKAGWSIAIKGCHVTVSGLTQDSEVLVYTTEGILRHSAMPFLGICEFDLTPGIYVVRAEGSSRVIQTSLHNQ